MSTTHTPPTNRRELKAQQRALKAQRKALRPWYRRPKLLLALVLALAAFGVIAGVASGGSSSTDNAPTVTGPTGGPTAETPAASFPGQQDDDTVAQAGETITADQIAYTAAPLAAGEPFGSEQVVCSTVQLVNNGTETTSYNQFEWKLQNPGGSITSPTIAAGNLLTSGELAPGGTVSGDVCFTGSLTNPGTYVLFHESIASFSGDREAWVSAR